MRKIYLEMEPVIRDHTHCEGCGEIKDTTFFLAVSPGRNPENSLQLCDTCQDKVLRRIGVKKPKSVWGQWWTRRQKVIASALVGAGMVLVGAVIWLAERFAFWLDK